MTIQICTECLHEYDDEAVNIPSPIEDKMCFKCGTVLSDEEIALLVHGSQGAAEQTQGA